MLANFSCGSAQSDEKILATVGDKNLYASELTGLENEKTVKNYVKQWVNHQILVQYAAKENSETGKIDEMVEQYKNDLILAEYEKSFLSKTLDTAVTATQINEFYKSNQALFELRDYVINVFYMKFDVADNTGNIGAEIKKCRSYEDAVAVEKKYAAKAQFVYLEPSSWIFLSDLLREVPLKVENKGRFLETTPFIEASTEDQVYYVRIFEYKLKNEISPLNLVSGKIKTLILRNRSQELLQANRVKIINEFKKDNEVVEYQK